jgi:hypothetical protein
MKRMEERTLKEKIRASLLERYRRFLEMKNISKENGEKLVSMRKFLCKNSVQLVKFNYLFDSNNLKVNLVFIL